MRVACTILCSADERYCDARKARAPRERTTADAYDAVGDCHARKARAPRERTLTDACYAARDRYARNAPATRERIVINLVTLSVVIFRKNQIGIITYVANKIINSAISVEKISVFINYL